MEKNFELIKGFRDYTGEDARKRNEIKRIIVENFEKFGFEPAETPIIESEEFAKGDNKEDEAVSDIYKLEDKGKRKLALRYEFTFQLKRLMNNKKLPWRRYQIGELFRDEPVGPNRFRQFTQCDADVVGSTIKDEAEILALTGEILKNLGIEFLIYVGNRKLINEIIGKENIKGNKKQILREIDKLDKLEEGEIKTNLKKFGADKLIEIFKKPESYFKKYKSFAEFEELKNYCKSYGVEIKFSPSLVRGFSYYNGNVFEVKNKKIRETLTGGGSYEFNGIQCTGISFGIERLSLLAQIKKEQEKFLVISLNEDKKSIELSQKLRNQGKIVSIYYGKPSKALEYANSYGINKVIFVGETEVKNKRFMIKNMETGKESALKI